MNIDALHHAFIEPVASYRIAPLFRINDEVNPDQLRWQVRSLKEQGCGGVFAYCERMGGCAPQPFLSDWWWNVARAIVNWEHVNLGAVCKGDNVVLDLGRVGVSAEVRVNGRWAGYAVFPPYRVAITPYVQEGSNRIEVIVANTLLNYYSRYTPLRQAPKYAGGTANNRASGPLGPVRILITD